MKKRVCRILIGVALCLAAVGTSQAMSTFVSMTIEPQWPDTTTPGNVVLYKITTVVREGSGLLEVVLSSAGRVEVFQSMIEIYLPGSIASKSYLAIRR